MKQIVIVGAGKIGGAVARMLAATKDYQVTLSDANDAQLAGFNSLDGITTSLVDIKDHTSLVSLLTGKFAVLSAAPFHLTGLVAKAAVDAGTHYLDLTEDVTTTRRVESLAEQAKSALIPQCGLAPGFISIVAADLAGRFDTLDSVRMRVGALPQYPSNALNYNLTWSTDGLINEYIEPCEAVVEGRLISVPAMEEREEFSLDGVTYEAFNTSGGLGTLAKTLEGKVRTMNYRTIRYPGHQAIVKALLNDFNLRNRRDVLKDLFENALPATNQDVVVIFVTVCGWRDGRYLQETYANKIYAGTVAGHRMSAIQITTAAGISAVLDLLAEGQLPASGFVRQEEIRLGAFLSNRFGQMYAHRPSNSESSKGFETLPELKDAAVLGLARDASLAEVGRVLP
ncbi:MAG: saccharopine dehydrogenase family protein [Alphaproteobacteria bacterium]|uniref:saccharopine dehydrogenase family protein n=1 Tax=Rhizobium sp. CFBP 13726 TaxID=2775296 RepID=UPI0010F02F21|nr:saccharopine dehydrogenase family protein [Rhizobium sp. CFBP 13726]MBD8653555.1 saccharopine dehydrogenase family protein [Rhizobium sp. CFBP 13726]RYG97813.1 MAG: saccharopine dehydrogenase family protein [Alphaproteobacteria bacterium]